jgi:hypothetical protein
MKSELKFAGACLQELAVEMSSHSTMSVFDAYLHDQIVKFYGKQNTITVNVVIEQSE